VLELSTIRNSAKIHQLLRLLAFQIGSEVSLNEIANNLGMSQETVASYIDLLEKVFVLFRLVTLYSE
jgi:predicted AAA+ superfamily ATPase